MSFPAYPPILTVANWDSKKGVFAKIFKGETGVGAAMTTAKAAYDKLDQITLAPKMAYKSYQELEEAVEAAKAKYSSVEPVRKALFALSDKADKASAEFKKHKLIPSSAGAHAKKVSEAASNLATALKSIDELWKEAKKKLAGKFEIAMKNVTDGIKLVRDKAPGVLKNPTPENYNSNMWQGLRTMGAAVAVCPDTAGFKAETKQLSSIQPNDLSDPTAMKAHVNKVLDLAKRIEQHLA